MVHYCDPSSGIEFKLAMLVVSSLASISQGRDFLSYVSFGLFPEETDSYIDVYNINYTVFFYNNADHLPNCILPYLEQISRRISIIQVVEQD